ncbi:hypothetical protein E4T56_gene494 [Termitomyces sp. T112]|nr:hypothetical protein E4T56_gene494 [Termitomyces sp. T112]
MSIQPFTIYPSSTSRPALRLTSLAQMGLLCPVGYKMDQTTRGGCLNGLTQPSNLKDGAPLQGVISAVPWEIVPNETNSTVLEDPRAWNVVQCGSLRWLHDQWDFGRALEPRDGSVPYLEVRQSAMDPFRRPCRSSNRV